jgi:hypothetical protein
MELTEFLSKKAGDAGRDCLPGRNIIAENKGGANMSLFKNPASDPWMLTPDEAQAALQKEIKDWQEYVRIAKIEPQG